MRIHTRSLSLDICDYHNNVLCNLYDNNSDISGQATDVFVNYERNGWKELTFDIPSVCYSEDGEEENYRLQYLVADYRIRLINDYETDWFIISERQITHNAFSKNVSVRAGHICQMLKNKNLNLEFSDEEGNNTGTPSMLLKAILEGTGWHIGKCDDNDFKEDDGTLKYRSISEAAKTGAFKMIEDLCDVFEAKAVYHGEALYKDDEGITQTGRTVDFVPMNPFSHVKEGEIPEAVLNGTDVVEIHYDKNAHSISKTENTENMVTKFYAFGSYGDMNELCSIEICKHTELRFIIGGVYNVGKEFMFTDPKGLDWYFTIENIVGPTSKLVWSMLDYTSMTYVWDENRKVAYRTRTEPATQTYTSLNYNTETLQNYFPFLFNFNYYDRVGLLTDEMLQDIAKYQREVAANYKHTLDLSTSFTNAKDDLSYVAESQTGYLKLHVTGFNTGDGNALQLELSPENEGVIYRTDYRERRDNYFKWYVASDLKPDGTPVQGIGSVVFIIQDGAPLKCERAYVKAIYDNNGQLYVGDDGKPKEFDYKLDEGYPSKIELWLERRKDSGDRDVISYENSDFYLFCTDSLIGKLGTLLDGSTRVKQALDSDNKVATVEHVTHFVDKRDPKPDCPTSGYEWLYMYNANRDEHGEYALGELYFCWAARDDNKWYRVNLSNTTSVAGEYYYNEYYNALYHAENLGDGVGWKKLDNSETEKKMGSYFGKVMQSVRTRDMYFHGVYETYKYDIGNKLDKGNYAVESPYGFFWTFSLDKDAVKPAGQDKSYIIIDTLNKQVTHDGSVETVVKVVNYPYYTPVYPEEGPLEDYRFTEGFLDDDGEEVPNSENKYGYKSNNIRVYENVPYRFECSLLNTRSGSIFFYDMNGRFLSKMALTPQINITTPVNTKNARIVIMDITEPPETGYFHVQDFSHRLFISDEMYTILEDLEPEGDLYGIHNYMKKFNTLSDLTYLSLLPALLEAQNVTVQRTNELNEELGELVREGYWQDDKYVGGSEDKLYKDAMENLEKIAEPETNYSMTFLDLYGSNRDMGFSVDDDEEVYKNVQYPDIQITNAAHLVDPDIATNRWAYIDKLNKCYDQPWKTTIEINTQLTLMTQHEFTDVLSKIAEVSNQTKANQSIYKRAALLSGSGLTTDKLEGAIQANRTLLTGGESNWRTDSKGNIIFETADGNSAVLIAGSGLAVANSKDEYGDWEWRNAITGLGITADVIVAGTINTKLLAAGSIETEKLSPGVGETLVISNNPSISGINATISLLPDQIISRVSEDIVPTTYISETDPTLDPANTVKKGDYWIKQCTRQIPKQKNNEEEVVAGDGEEVSGNENSEEQDQEEYDEEAYNEYYTYQEIEGSLTWIEINDASRLNTAFTQITQTTERISAVAEAVEANTTFRTEIGLEAGVIKSSVAQTETNKTNITNIIQGSQSIAFVATSTDGESHIEIQGNQIDLGTDGTILINSTDKIQIGSTGETTSLQALLNEKGTMTSAVQEFILSSSDSSCIPYVIDPTTVPPTESEWSTTAPTHTNDAYIWMRTHITSGTGQDAQESYLPNEYGVCISGYNGEDGQPGNPGYNTATVVLYKRSADTLTNSDKPDSVTYNFSTAIASSTNFNGWQQSIPMGDNPCYSIAAFVASRESKVTISGTDWTAPSLVLKNGTNGSPGVGIQSVSEKYIATDSTTEPADNAGWVETLTLPTESNPYLWNWEVITDTNDQQKSSEKRIIGTYSKDGRSIDHITNYYLATSATTVDKTDEGWTDTVQTVSAEQKYLWNYEIIYDSQEETDDTKISETEPHIIGSYEKGDDGTSVMNFFLYKRSASVPSGPTASTGYKVTYTVNTNTFSRIENGWTANIPTGTDSCYAVTTTKAVAAGTNIIEFETSDWSSPVKAFENGKDGKGVSSIITTYLWTTDGFEPPSEDSNAWRGKDDVYTIQDGVPADRIGKKYFSIPPNDTQTYYLWFKTVTTYTDNTHDTTVRSEYGVNAAHMRAQSAEETANAIVSGTANVFLNSQVTNAGFTYKKVGETEEGDPIYRTTVGANGDMVIAANGGLYIARVNPDSGQEFNPASQSAIVMNKTGMAIMSDATLTLASTDALVFKITDQQTQQTTTQTVTQYVRGMITSEISDLYVPQHYSGSTKPQNAHVGDYWTYTDTDDSMTIKKVIVMNYLLAHPAEEEAEESEAEEEAAEQADYWFKTTYGEQDEDGVWHDPEWASDDCANPVYVCSASGTWIQVDEKVDAVATNSIIQQKTDNITLGVTSGVLAAGRVTTQESIIDIYDNEIDVASSGVVNIEGGTINILATYDENNQLISSGDINIGADSAINISSGSAINMTSGSYISISSEATTMPGRIEISSIGIEDEETHKTETFGLVTIDGAIVNIGSDNNTAMLNITSGGSLNITGGDVYIADSTGANAMWFTNNELTMAADKLSIYSNGAEVSIDNYISSKISGDFSQTFYQDTDPRDDATPPTLHTGDLWIHHTVNYDHWENVYRPPDDPPEQGKIYGTRKWGSNGQPMQISWASIKNLIETRMWDALSGQNGAWVRVPAEAALDQTITNVSTELNQTAHAIRLEAKESNATLRTEFQSLLEVTASKIEARVESAERKTRYIQNDGHIEMAAFTKMSAQNLISKKAGISLDAEGKIMIEAMTENAAGALTAASMNLDVSGDSPKITLSAENFKKIEGSGMTITPNSISINTTGILTISSGNFQLDSTGNIRCTGGTIGGFAVSSDTFVSNVGGAGYVYMSCAGIWAFAAGSQTGDPADASFRVTPQGDVYISRLMVKSSATEWEAIDFTSFATQADLAGGFSKLKYNTVVSMVGGGSGGYSGIKLSNGQTYNFA